MLATELRPGMMFTAPVYMGNTTGLLVGANIPLQASDIERLKKWKIDDVETEGTLLATSVSVASASSLGLRQNIEKNINELYKNLIQNREKCKTSYHEMLDKTRMVLSKFKSLKEIDEVKITSIYTQMSTEIDQRKSLLLNLLVQKNTFDYIVSHSICVAIISLVIAKYLGYSSERQLELTRAAILHNCGMLFFPGELANKKGKYTEKEMQQVKTHPLVGYKMLYEEGMASMKVSLAALEHHENFNGTGYPRGISGMDISDYARIISIGDVYTALAIEREYRNKLNTYLALREIVNQANIKFDPEMVRVFVMAMSIYPISTIVKMNNKCTVIVVEVNEEGTEAAAATGVAMGLKSMPMAAPKFRADHPFIFLIQERATGKVIFMGRVEKP